MNEIVEILPDNFVSELERFKDGPESDRILWFLTKFYYMLNNCLYQLNTPTLRHRLEYSLNDLLNQIKYEFDIPSNRYFKVSSNGSVLSISYIIPEAE